MIMSKTECVSEIFLFTIQDVNGFRRRMDRCLLARHFKLMLEELLFSKPIYKHIKCHSHKCGMNAVAFHFQRGAPTKKHFLNLWFLALLT